MLGKTIEEMERRNSLLKNSNQSEGHGFLRLIQAAVDHRLVESSSNDNINKRKIPINDIDDEDDDDDDSNNNNDYDDDGDEDDIDKIKATEVKSTGIASTYEEEFGLLINELRCCKDGNFLDFSNKELLTRLKRLMTSQKSFRMSNSQKLLLIRLCIVHLMHREGYKFVDNLDRSFADWDSSIVCSTFGRSCAVCCSVSTLGKHLHSHGPSCPKLSKSEMLNYINQYIENHKLLTINCRPTTSTPMMPPVSIKKRKLSAVQDKEKFLPKRNVIVKSSSSLSSYNQKNLPKRNVTVRSSSLLSSSSSSSRPLVRNPQKKQQILKAIDEVYEMLDKAKKEVSNKYITIIIIIIITIIFRLINYPMQLRIIFELI